MRSLFSAMGMNWGGSRMPERRVVPADQGLDAHDLGGAQVDVGLVERGRTGCRRGRAMRSL